MTSAWCLCTEYVYWHTTPAGVDVCECGHPRGYHIEGERMCTGDVEVSR